MSKKMLKRSLALGALMAFVITGSAMAAEINEDTIRSEGIHVFETTTTPDDKEWNLKSYELWLDNQINDSNATHAVKAADYRIYGTQDSTLKIEAGEGKKITYGLAFYGSVDVGNLIIKTDSNAIEALVRESNIKATNIELVSNERNGISATEEGKVNLTSSGNLTITGAKNAISSGGSNTSVKVTSTGIANINGNLSSVEGGNVDMTLTGTTSQWTGAAITDESSKTLITLDKATWNMTGDSTISKLSGYNEGFNVVGQENTLNINGGGIWYAGTMTVKELNVDSDSSAVTSYKDIVINAENVNLASKNGSVIMTAIDDNPTGNVTVNFTGDMTVNGEGETKGIANNAPDGKININGAEGSSLTVSVPENAIINRYSGSELNIKAGEVIIESTGSDSTVKATTGAVTIDAFTELSITAKEGVNAIETVDGYNGDGGSISVGENTTKTTIVGNVAATKGSVDIALNSAESKLTGAITTSEEGAETTLTLNNGASWEITGVSTVTNVAGNEGKLVVTNTDNGVTINNNSNNSLTVQASEELTTAIENGDTTLQNVAQSIKVEEGVTTLNVATAETDIAGSSVLTYNVATRELGAVQNLVNAKNQAISDAGVNLKAHWRAHMNDMNKRMGELRDANGEAGVWTRMVRGEAEFDGAKAQYNQYQVGYDQKAGDWYVGAAVTYAEGDSNYGYGSTDDKSTAFAIYGSKLNQDGSFVDLIARYANVESELDDIHAGTGDYDTDGYSISAEYGKRLQQGNGLWVEPQVELTYGTLDSADFVLSGTGKEVHVGDIDSLIGRVGFRIGKDIKEGNVYARASYLYDFDGETTTNFSKNGKSGDSIKEDLGGGWWKVGVGANINLSKATYIYADVEKTFGGEVDTNWQWNLGVRYSF